MRIAKLLTPEFNRAFKTLMQAKGLPVRTSYKLATIGRVIRSALEDYEASRQSIIHSYAEKDEHGNVKVEKVGEQTIAKIPTGLVQEVNAKINDLTDIDVQIKPLDVNDLGDVDAVTPEDLMHLEFITDLS